MTSREEAANFVREQLTWEYHKPNIPDRSEEEGVRRNDAWHYGRCDLRTLLDFIYGGPPTGKHEEV